MSAFALVLMVNLLQNLFSDRAFYVIITDADIGSLKSHHTLFEVFGPHAGVI